MEYIGFLDESIRHGVDESYGLAIISVDSIDIAYNTLISSYRKILRMMGADYTLEEAKFSAFLATIYKRLGLLTQKDIYKFVAPIIRSLSQHVFLRGILLQSETQLPSLYLDIERIINEELFLRAYRRRMGKKASKPQKRTIKLLQILNILLSFIPKPRRIILDQNFGNLGKHIKQLIITTEILHNTKTTLDSSANNKGLQIADFIAGALSLDPTQHNSIPQQKHNPTKHTKKQKIQQTTMPAPLQ